jgi:dTDP-4-dehydrorhamnose reductase
MRALVIGASGQIGGHLLAELARRGHAAVGTRRGFAVPGLPSLDIANDAHVRQAIADVRPGAVFLPAGFTWVDGCEKDPERAFRENRDLPLAVARAARDAGALFVHFSTDYVFDGKDGPYGEDAPASPVSVYGRAKLEAEERLRAEVPAHVIARTTTVYGPELQGKNFVFQVVAKARKGETMQVPHDQVSTPSYGPDVARAVVELVEARARGTFHVAGPDLIDRAAFGRLACEVLGLDPRTIVPVATADLGQPAARPLRGGLRCDKLASLGLDVRLRDAREGLTAFAEWLRSRPA